MSKDKMNMLILSCDNFSDLWDGHVKLLERHWSNRNMKTYIVTECGDETKHYKNVEILAAGQNTEWSERLAHALELIDVQYVFITLDDYFLIEDVSNEKIQYLVDLMDKEALDYIRLYPRPKRATRGLVEGTKNINWIDTTEKYSVNLYSSIWRKEFLLAMLKKKKNAWQFEVCLPKDATQYGARCAVSHLNEFVILDVVRKGKLLHKSAKYLRKHPDLYCGNREVQPWSYEIKLGIKTMVGRHTPKWLYTVIRGTMKKLGFKFVSDDPGE